MSKSAFKVWGKDTTFGTLLKVLYPTPISPFDFSVPIRGPWAMGGPRILPGARKTGIPDGKSRPEYSEKIAKSVIFLEVQGSEGNASLDPGKVFPG